MESKKKKIEITLMHSEWLKHDGVLVILSAKGLKKEVFSIAKTKHDNAKGPLHPCSTAVYPPADPHPQPHKERRPN